MRLLGYALIAAGVCWIVSEILELVYGGRTGLTLLLTAVFHLLMAAGIWAAYAGRAGARRRMSRIVVGMASAGYLMLVYPPIAVALDPSVTYPEFVKARLLFGAAGLLVTLGVTLFGAIVLRSHAYPTWVGLACVTCPALFVAVMLFDGPPLIGFATNVLLGSAFVAMGALAQPTREEVTMSRSTPSRSIEL